jgi:hypothetical protein
MCETEQIVKIIATMARYNVGVLKMAQQCLACHYNGLIFCRQYYCHPGQIWSGRDNEDFAKLCKSLQ